MKVLKPGICCCLGLALLVTSEQGLLVFSPAKCSTLTKHFTSELQLVLDKMEISIGDADSSFWFDGVRTNMEFNQTFTVSDTYGRIAEGRPVTLDRVFERLEQRAEVFYEGGTWGGAYPLQVVTVTGESELEWATVRFELEDEVYAKSFLHNDPHSDGDLLVGLTEDMDLRCLLPERPLEKWQRWEIELSAVPDLLSPGGSLAWEHDVEGRSSFSAISFDALLMRELRSTLADSLEGEAWATYVGEDDGLGVIWLEVDIQCEQDSEELRVLTERLLAGSFESLYPVVEYQELEFTLGGWGTAKWDIEAGHISSLEMSSIVSLKLKFGVMVMDKFVVHFYLELSGALEQLLATE